MIGIEEAQDFITDCLNSPQTPFQTSLHGPVLGPWHLRATARQLGFRDRGAWRNLECESWLSPETRRVNKLISSVKFVSFAFPSPTPRTQTSLLSGPRRHTLLVALRASPVFKDLTRCLRLWAGNKRETQCFLFNGSSTRWSCPSARREAATGATRVDGAGTECTRLTLAARRCQRFPTGLRS